MSKIEELEKRIESLEQIVESLKKEHGIKHSQKKSSKLESLLSQHILKLKPQDLVILILYSKSKITKDEIKTKFRTLGATAKMLNWFNGGNFKQRLIDTGIVFVEDKKESMFSLTKGKGIQTAEQIITKLESNS